MRKLTPFLLVILVMIIASFHKIEVSSIQPPVITEDTVHSPEEVHFKNVQQLTFGGDNAEAYWSYDSKYIVFQRTNPREGIKCDQIFIGKVPEKPGDKFEYRPLSSGKGRTTCPFFTKDG